MAILRELGEIAVAFLALSFAFSYPDLLGNPSFLEIAMLAVGVGFVGHELMHRFVAKRFGYEAAFRIWPQGILFAVGLAILTNGAFIFAAPGAVVFGSRSGKYALGDVGKIGLAGPAFNLVLFGILTVLSVPFPMLGLAARVNAWLALFNLIPFGPLDGQKVLAWSKPAWSVAVALAAIGVFVF